MKIIWDSQNDQPLYAIDEQALHSRIEHNTQKFNRGVFWRDVREIGIGLVVGLLFVCLGANIAWGSGTWLALIFKTQVEGNWLDAVGFFLSGAIWLYYSSYQYLGRKQQHRREASFDASLRGDLDRALSQLNYQITMSQNVLWWGLLPVFSATILAILIQIKLTAGPILTQNPLKVTAIMAAAASLMLAALALDYRCKTKPIHKELLPRKRDLESLRKKLADQQN